MMSYNRKYIEIVAVVLLAVLLFSCDDETKVISGKVAVAGNEPFSYVRVIDQNNVEYKLVGPLVEGLRKSYQGKVVKLRGKVIKRAVGPGFPAEFLVAKILD